jgi:hypothetical protein
MLNSGEGHEKIDLTWGEPSRRRSHDKGGNQRPAGAGLLSQEQIHSRDTLLTFPEGSPTS